MTLAIGDWIASKRAHTGVWHVNPRRTTLREHTHYIVLDWCISLVPGVVSVVAHINVGTPSRDRMPSAGAVISIVEGKSTLGNDYPRRPAMLVPAEIATRRNDVLHDGDVGNIHAVTESLS